MHLYEWQPRIFTKLPPPISKPFTSEVWTDRIAPGINTYAENPEGVAEHLVSLIAFAKGQLSHLRHLWHTFPIFLKATAGMRELPLEQRLPIMLATRAFLRNDATCPFQFNDDEQARVISGEEEAAFAWAGINFASGALLESQEKWGASSTLSPDNAYGTLEMGGASHQIAFFQPEQSILANLFKLQIGGSKHWNLYAHSHLQYGRVSAKARLWSHLVDQAGCFARGGPGKRVRLPGQDPAVVDVAGTPELATCEVVDACLSRGLAVEPLNTVTGRVEVHPPMAYHPINTRVSIQSASTPYAAPGGGGGGASGPKADEARPDDDAAADDYLDVSAQASAGTQWDACLAQVNAAGERCGRTLRATTSPTHFFFTSCHVFGLFGLFAS